LKFNLINTKRCRVQLDIGSVRLKGPFLIDIGRAVQFPRGAKRSEHEADDSSQLMFQVKNQYSYNSTLPYAFMACTFPLISINIQKSDLSLKSLTKRKIAALLSV
jgi:hypothetical protein